MFKNQHNFYIRNAKMKHGTFEIYIKLRSQDYVLFLYILYAILKIASD